MNEEWLVRLTAQHVLVRLPEEILGPLRPRAESQLRVRKIGLDRSRVNRSVSVKRNPGVTPAKNKKGLRHCKPLILLVARGGIEPSTRGFSIRCSTN